jgi:hypothetical protein
VKEITNRGGSKGARGIKPPYLPKINGYPLNPTLFLGIRNEEEDGREKKRMGGRRR